MNWPTDIPPDVAAAQEKSWSVTSVQSQGVVLTYYRDCGVDIRGPVTDEYPYGYLFGSLFCRGDGAMIAMMGNFEKDPSADQKLVTEVKRIMPELEASRNCAEKRITPVS
ncbi:hypothetical protein EON76_02875 [bacterium]|nr:MAG: hypothetical protein EON76_02875 [bacterium]